MSELLVAIDRSTIREGRRGELEAAIGYLADFVRRNEPRVIAYSVYLEEHRPEMTVLQVHPDSASMEPQKGFARLQEAAEVEALDGQGSAGPQTPSTEDREGQTKGIQPCRLG